MNYTRLGNLRRQRLKVKQSVSESGRKSNISKKWKETLEKTLKAEAGICSIRMAEYKVR